MTGSPASPAFTLEVVRGSPDTGPRLMKYIVPYVEGMSLLDALFWLREHLDPTLTVRFSCRSANACKECSTLVNGKAAYLCVTKAAPDAVFRIEPLPKRRWIRDAVVAMESER